MWVYKMGVLEADKNFASEILYDLSRILASYTHMIDYRLALLQSLCSKNFYPYLFLDLDLNHQERSYGSFSILTVLH